MQGTRPLPKPERRYATNGSRSRKLLENHAWSLLWVQPWQTSAEADQIGLHGGTRNKILEFLRIGEEVVQFLAAIPIPNVMKPSVEA